jgi:hypothetical protein
MHRIAPYDDGGGWSKARPAVPRGGFRSMCRCPAVSGPPGLGPSHASDGGDRGRAGLTASSDGAQSRADRRPRHTVSAILTREVPAVVLREARTGKRWRW